MVSNLRVVVVGRQQFANLLGVGFAVAQWNDRLRECLSQRGGVGPPEDDLRLPVPIRNFPLRVGTRERIKGGLEYVAGSPFAGFKFHRLSGK